MRKRLTAVLICLCLLLTLLPATALAAAPEGQLIYVGDVDVTSGGYWTTDSDGSVTQYTEGGTPSDNYIHYDTDTNTLTLHNATIKTSNAHMNLSGSALGVLNGSGDVDLTIQLEGDNTIENVSMGICVYSYSDGTATLTITGNGSLDASGSQTGIMVQSNSGDAALSINNAKVTATSTGYNDGVRIQSSDSSNALLTVDGGSLTATGSGNYSAGINLQFGSGGSSSGTPTVTVSENAIVKASSSNGGGIASNSGSVTPSGTGIVFNGNEGTVYGNVTLQENLTIGEGESLALDDGASLSAGGHNVIMDGGTLDSTLATSLGDSVKYTPTITTTSPLSNGTVGTYYEQALAADGTTPITWSVSNGNLPAGLSLNGNTISGTPTTAGTSTFTVTATNGYGNGDGKEFNITIDAQTNVPVTGVSLNMNTLNLIEGSSGTLTATVEPSNATNKNVTWSSDNESVATVNDGVVTAVSEGTANITVTTLDGNKTAICAVTVTARTYNISANPATLDFGSVNAGYMAAPVEQIVTITNRGNQNVTLNQPTAENYEVGSLSTDTLTPGATATFTVQPKAGLAIGTYSETITVSGSDGASTSLTASFTVSAISVSGVSLNTSTLRLTEGDTDTLTATVEPDNATNKNVTWSSDDESVATVSDGVVTAVAAGTATITVTTEDGNKTATCVVTVTHGNLTHTPGNAATCTEDGNEEYWTCNICGKHFSDAGGNTEITLEQTVIPATDHSYGEPVWSWSEDGKSCTVTFICANDETHRATSEVTITSEVKTAASCTEKGVTEYTATAEFNGITYTDTRDVADIPVTDHHYENGRCSVCRAIDSSFKPVITAGAGSTWQKGSRDGLSFTSSAAFADFVKVQVDGRDLAASDYEVREGSTIVTLNASYLETLSVGQHTLSIVSDTGTATTEFTIQAAPSTRDEEHTQSPQTGDNSNIALWIILLFISGSSAVILSAYYAKRRKN